MLKNYKIPSLIIPLTSIGVLIILGIWLRTNYKENREISIVNIEQSLISSVSNYYSFENKPRRRKGRSKYNEYLANKIKETYPEVNVDTLYEVMRRSATTIQQNFRNRNRNVNRIPPPEMDEPRGSQPSSRGNNMWELYNQNIIVSKADLDSISIILQKELEAKDITGLDIEIQSFTLSSESGEMSQRLAHAEGSTETRHLLINPESDLFINVKILSMWKYLLLKMAWQIIFAAILILALFGSFFALLASIRKQQKLAKLQRTFVNNMTHELKTPLSTVGASIEAIQRFGAKNDQTRMNKYLDLSRKEIDHLNHMVDRVLQFNADENSGYNLQLRETNLVALIENLCQSYKLAKTEDVEINFRTDAEQVNALVDDSHIKNVLSNLVDNALKYNVSDKKTVDIELNSNAKNTTIKIVDNGIGIPKTYHDNIFELFFRVPNGDIYSVKGFGLGLAYVQQIIKSHGGSIQVDSIEDKGTTFTIKLPR